MLSTAANGKLSCNRTVINHYTVPIQVQFQNLQAKVVLQGHRVKVKVTGPKKRVCTSIFCFIGAIYIYCIVYSAILLFVLLHPKFWK